MLGTAGAGSVDQAASPAANLSNLTPSLPAVVRPDTSVLTRAPLPRAPALEITVPGLAS